MRSRCIILSPNHRLPPDEVQAPTSPLPPTVTQCRNRLPGWQSRSGAMSKWQALLQRTAGQPLIAGLIARAGRIERVTLSSVVLAASLLFLFASLGNAVGRGAPAF